MSSHGLVTIILILFILRRTIFLELFAVRTYSHNPLASIIAGLKTLKLGYIVVLTRMVKCSYANNERNQAVLGAEVTRQDWATLRTLNASAWHMFVQHNLRCLRYHETNATTDPGPVIRTLMDIHYHEIINLKADSTSNYDNIMPGRRADIDHDPGYTWILRAYFTSLWVTRLSEES